jgi:hypothetical protein
MGTHPSFASSALVASVVDTDIVVALDFVWDSLGMCSCLNTWWIYDISHMIGVCSPRGG